VEHNRKERGVLVHYIRIGILTANMALKVGPLFERQYLNEGEY